MKFLIVLAFMVSSAYADVYKCSSGNKTMYQDVPCPNVPLMSKLDSQAPSRQEQDQAIGQAAKERALLADLSKAREAQERTAAVTSSKPKPKPAPAASRAKQPDNYYDRPDRYYGRPDRYENRAANNARPIKSR